MAREKKVLNEILLGVSKAFRCRLFRNNVAKSYVGRVVNRENIDGELCVTIYPARILHSGLIEGSSDLIGWTTITITPEMVGKDIAVFTAVEAKTGNQKLRKTQKIFIDNVTNAGGIAGMVKSENETLELIQKFNQG